MKNSWQIHDNSCLKKTNTDTMKKEFVSKQDLGVAYFPITILHKIILTRIIIN